MFGQRLLIISFIILAFCQFHAHAAVTTPKPNDKPAQQPTEAPPAPVQPDVTAEAPTDAPTGSATQYAVPMMILSALPVYYMI